MTGLDMTGLDMTGLDMTGLDMTGLDMAGLDWGGPNEAWERQSMQLLAEQAMPKLCQHVAAQATR